MLEEYGRTRRLCISSNPTLRSSRNKSQSFTRPSSRQRVTFSAVPYRGRGLHHDAAGYRQGAAVRGDLCGGGGGEQAGPESVHGADVHPAGQVMPASHWLIHNIILASHWSVSAMVRARTRWPPSRPPPGMGWTTSS